MQFIIFATNASEEVSALSVMFNYVCNLPTYLKEGLIFMCHLQYLHCLYECLASKIAFLRH